MIKKLIFFCFTSFSLFNAVFSDNWYSPYVNYCASSFSFTNTAFEVGYATGKYITLDQDYTEIGMFMPILNSNDNQFFFDVKGYCFDNGKWGESAGFGYRTRYLEKGIFGINFYYDGITAQRHRYWNKHSYNQVGLGLEWLTECYDIRTNIYLPYGVKLYKSHKCTFDDFSEGFFAKSRILDFAYGGIDGEIGTTAFCRYGFELYAAAGGYYYQRARARNFWGGLARLEISWKDYISIQGIVTADKENHANVQGIFRLSLPLSLLGLKAICSCDGLFQPVRRNGVILTDHCCDWSWNWDDN